MPIMNGLEAASLLRSYFPSMPIILFTLYEDTLSGWTAAELPVSLVLLKTMPVSTLIDSAHQLIDA
jgi:DNA-binding NarL/FixJ family response regulator